MSLELFAKRGEFFDPFLLQDSVNDQRGMHTRRRTRFLYLFPSPPSSSSFSSRRKSWLEEKRLTCLHFAEWEEGAKGCAINGRSQLADKIRGGRAFKWRNFREWAMMRERERVDNGEKSWISKANIFQCLGGEGKKVTPLNGGRV